MLSLGHLPETENKMCTVKRREAGEIVGKAMVKGKATAREKRTEKARKLRRKGTHEAFASFVGSEGRSGLRQAGLGPRNSARHGHILSPSLPGPPFQPEWDTSL